MINYTYNVYVFTIKIESYLTKSIQYCKEDTAEDAFLVELLRRQDLEVSFRSTVNLGVIILRDRCQLG